MTRLDFGEITKDRPEKSLTERHQQDRRAQQPGARDHYRFRGGGHKRRYRTIDFRRDKRGVPAKVAASSTTRTARRGSRSCTTPTARSATSSRPTASRSGTTVGGRREAPTSCRATRCRCKNIPLGTMIHNVELQAGQGRPDRARGRRRRPARGQGGRLRPGQAAVGRGAHGPRRLPWRRSARSATSTTRTSRSARRAATAGSAGARTSAAWR